MDNQERHYNINKLNILFAVSSLGLLAALGWMVMKDYSREWKEYQKDFRVLEIEATRMKQDAQRVHLEGEGEYQKILEELEGAKKEYARNCSGLSETENAIKKLKAENDLLSQNQKFTVARLDAARYRLESGRASGSLNLEASQKEFDELSENVAALKLRVEESNQKLAQKNKIIDDCAQHLKEVQRKESSFAAKRNILDLKLAKIDPDKMDFTNRIADMVRDLPVIDLANPKYKIQQIVLKDITDDVNFMQVPKVDRCVTCHLGISNSDYKEAPQPFKTHPKLDVFLGRDSAHPVEEFGCTVCHGGRGRGTAFVSSVHTPSSKAQAKEWKEKYDWHKLHHWDKPMLPLQYTQASCFKCHSGEVTVKEADKLNLGLNIIEKAGCYNCHLIEKYKDWPKPGPSLEKIASKVSKDWAYQWIQDPQSFRHRTWMPSFFNQTNGSDPESKKRASQEIHAMVHYLFQNSEGYAKSNIPKAGNVKRGEELVTSVGCFACHQIESKLSSQGVTLDMLRKEHGPNFIGTGTKVSKKWIYNWIKDPSSYHSDTKMPNMRLTDQEASDISSYLTTLTNKEFSKTPVPPVDEGGIDDIVLGFLQRGKPQRVAQKELGSMALDEKLNFAGKKLIRHYGCFSCHNIKGFENDKPIGTELTEEGDKSVHNLDFGFSHIEHTNYAWFTAKLKNPRIFDEGRIKAHDEKLRMPNFNFNDQEIEAVTTALLGFVRESPAKKIVPRTARNLEIEAGQKIVRQLNCRGCHIIEGEGGSIQDDVKDWLVKYDGRAQKDAEALVTSFSPPNLIGEGQKVRAQWLFDFIHNPTIIRPWLKTRMPTYKFEADELNSLLKYFSALDDQEFPFEEKIDTDLSLNEFHAAKKLFSSDYFDCAKCHIVGDKLPDGSPDSWAPNFALTKTRLKPEWIIKWIIDPQSLLPGTKMPSYFDPQGFEFSGPDDILDGDEHEQIRVLRNYLLTLSGSSEKETEEDVKLDSSLLRSSE
mgnify:CR=1 FL=1